MRDMAQLPIRFFQRYRPLLQLLDQLRHALVVRRPAVEFILFRCSFLSHDRMDRSLEALLLRAVPHLNCFGKGNIRLHQTGVKGLLLF